MSKCRRPDKQNQDTPLTTKITTVKPTGTMGGMAIHSIGLYPSTASGTNWITTNVGYTYYVDKYGYVTEPNNNYVEPAPKVDPDKPKFPAFNEFKSEKAKQQYYNQIKQKYPKLFGNAA